MDAKVLRHELNRNAELSWKEYRTTEIICDFLKGANIKFQKLPKTGLIAKGGKGRPVLLRAELDALPFGKEVKHACGHDVHAAALASALSSIKSPYVAVFQPSEEDYPSGARHAMGHVQGFKYAVAVHVDPTLPIGTVGIKAGYVMGSVDLIRIQVKGKSAHTAFPNEGCDAIAAASEMIRKIRTTFTSRKCSVVISKIHGGTKDNIVCDNVEMEGTSRTLDEEMRFGIKHKIEGLCRKAEIKYGAKVQFNFIEGYPALYNDIELAKSIREKLKAEFGDSNIVLGTPCMANDDFAFFSEKGPICYIRVGCGGGKLHTREFYPGDEVVDICRRAFIAASQ